jgi:WD40 repeat protein
VPILVASLIALPVAPIAAIFATEAWPVTVPAALGWLALMRWDRSRERLGATPSASAAIVLAAALLVLRFTLPSVTVSAVGGSCLAFPGETVRAIAWSPDGDWLGVASELDSAGIVRVIKQDSGKIIELARGPYINAAFSGLAVGPGGVTSYLVDVEGASARPEEQGASVWVASPTAAPRRFADLPTPAVSDLTWTPEGIAAVQHVDTTSWTETHRMVWVKPNPRGAGILDPIASELLLDYPVLAPSVNPWPAQMTVRTPSGDQTVDYPPDATGDVSVTSDGAFLVFHARALTDDEVDDKHNEVVAESTENGHRSVLVPGDGWTPEVAAGRLAYLTFPAYPNNSVCVKGVAIE